MPGTEFEPQTIPQKPGVGLKAKHYQDILEQAPDIGWFEVHPENYMGAGGPPHHYLTKIRERYPLSLHGVGLSIGGEGALCKDHLGRLKALVARYAPGLFSEHLAWSTHDDTFYNDLLPVAYDKATLDRVVSHIDQVQETVGRQMLLENPSTYVAWSTSTMSETDFIREVQCRSGCGLLFDVNNVYVSCKNHGLDPVTYIHDFPLEKVQEIHLGGHAPDTDDMGEPLLIDAHDREVDEAVWSLFELTIETAGKIPTLVEWDNNVPEWDVLFAEAKSAGKILERAGRKHAVAA